MSTYATFWGHRAKRAADRRVAKILEEKKAEAAAAALEESNR